ncbi:mechanosensitive ion channel family protein [Actinokineospora globicatena]|uniref:Uncharacterized protein n=1 Tax=Actinokineospora globicatena TaxID=103729 RepID=A0A9W6V975_9PSEU|nr:hypothetical protein [Actinokineospora globicatena]GLW90741.1 hypothetical protein Aglo03_15570 [Actinokineospora globicatena]
MAVSQLAAVDIGAGFSDAWRMVITFVPRLIGFALVLGIGYLVARFAAKVVTKVLARVGFERVVDRGGIRQMLARSRFEASEIIAKLVYYAILLVTLQVAFGVWGSNPVSALLSDIVAWLPKAAVALLIVVVAAAIARGVRDFITAVLGGLSYGKALATAASVFIVALGIIAALNQVGIATTVTMPVLITVLATAGGIAIVGIGGGMIRPMQRRWEGWLDRAEHEIPKMREHMEAHPVTREPAHSGAPAQAWNAQGMHQPQMTQPGMHPTGSYPSMPPQPGPYGGQMGGPGQMPAPPQHPYGQIPPYGQAPPSR